MTARTGAATTAVVGSLKVNESQFTPGAVALDATGSFGNVTSVASYNYTGITVGSNPNRVLLAFFTTGTAATSPTAVWDSGGSNQTMTVLGHLAMQTNANRVLWVYGLVNPTPGNKTLAFTWGGTTDPGIHVGAISFYNVDQTGGSTTFYNQSLVTTATISTTASTSININTKDAGVGFEQGDVGFSSNSPTSWLLDSPTATSGNYVLGAGTGVVFSGTGASTQSWVVFATALKAAPTTTTWQGAATFTGAGGIIENEDQFFAGRAALVGAGSLSARAVELEAARSTFAGAGSLAVNATQISGGVIQQAAASFAGAGLVGSLSGPALTPSGPVTITANGQIVDSLAITSTSGHAITGSGFSGVIIRNCLIHHAGTAACGIHLLNCPSAQIYNNNIINDSAPSVGQNPSEQNNLNIESCNSISITNNRVQDGSTGIYLLTSDSPTIDGLEGYNMRGPMPRGQLVQFNQCTGTPVLKNFSVKNDLNVCWTEDGINCGNSPGVQISNGLIDGNNSPSGVGVLCELNSNNVSVSNVDCINWSNGAFSSVGLSNVSFTNCRARDSYTPCSQGRGSPSSGGLAFASYSGATGTVFSGCIYYNLFPGCGTLWDSTTCAVADVTGPTSFTPRPYYTATLAGVVSGVPAQIIAAGSARFAGAGSLSANDQEQGKALFAGASALASRAAILETSSATFAGVGSFTGNAIKGGTVWQGAAQFNGAGFLAAAAFDLQPAAAIFAGSGSLAADAAPGRLSSAAFTGAGALSAAAGVITTGGAALAGLGSLAATAASLEASSAAFAGTGSLSARAAGVTIWQGAATFAGAGSLTAVATEIAVSRAAFAGVGALYATPGQFAIWPGAAAFAGLGAWTALATELENASAALAGAGSLAVSAAASESASAVFAGASSLAASGAELQAGSATFAGAGSLTAAAVGVTIWQASASFAGASTLAARATGLDVASGALAGSGSFTSAVAELQAGSASFSGAGSLSARAVGFVAWQSAASFGGVGFLAASAAELSSTGALLAGAGSLAVDATAQRLDGAAFAGAGSLAVAAAEIATARAAFAGAGSLTTVAGAGGTGAIWAGAGALSVATRVPAAGSGNFAGAGFLAAAATAREATSARFTGAGALTAVVDIPAQPHGILAATEAPDGAAAAGTIAWAAVLAATEAPDSFAAVATTPLLGSMAASEAPDRADFEGQSLKNPFAIKLYGQVAPRPGQPGYQPLVGQAQKTKVVGTASGPSSLIGQARSPPRNYGRAA